MDDQQSTSSSQQSTSRASDSTQSRTIVQPIILGNLNLPSASTQTTVGAAGSASALPAAPTGYLKVTLGKTVYVLPFYAAS